MTRPIEEAEREAFRHLKLLALHEGVESPAVRTERYRIASWIQQTIDEGWLLVPTGERNTQQ